MIPDTLIFPVETVCMSTHSDDMNRAPYPSSVESNEELLRWIQIDPCGQLNVTLPVARSYTAASTFSSPALIASRMTGDEVRSNSA